MSKSIAYKHYIRALSRWPKDNLRPECQLPDVLRKRIDERFLPASSTAVDINDAFELQQANALYSLVENRYSRKYAIKGSLLTPPGNPTHYTDLMRELEEAPRRSWWAQMTNKWKGFLRFR